MLLGLKALIEALNLHYATRSMYQPCEFRWCDVDEMKDDTLSRAHDKVSEQYGYSLTRPASLAGVMSPTQ